MAREVEINNARAAAIAKRNIVEEPVVEAVEEVVVEAPVEVVAEVVEAPVVEAPVEVVTEVVPETPVVEAAPEAPAAA